MQSWKRRRYCSKTGLSITTITNSTLHGWIVMKRVYLEYSEAQVTHIHIHMRKENDHVSLVVDLLVLGRSADKLR